MKDLEIIKKIGVFEYFHEYKKEWHERHIFLLHAKGKLKESWWHTVSSGTDDSGLMFEYYWLPFEKKDSLIAEQGSYFTVRNML